MLHALFRTCLVVALGAVTLAAQTTDRRLARPEQAAERRVALVVGNDSYAGAALTNGRNDARSVAAALREIGFQVTQLEDATQVGLSRAVADFGDSITSTDVAFFYFAGHGMQVGGENYLVPIDYRGTSPNAARLTTLAASQVQDTLSKAKVSMIVLDACRNNPYSGQRAGGAGLAAMEARGSLIAFATGAGQTASDNGGATNGLFTQELLRVLREPNLSAREAFYRVRQRVFDVSKGQQFPAVYDGLVGEFVFRSGGVAPPIHTSPTSSIDADLLRQREEIAFWESIPASADPQLARQLLTEYEERFGPKGRFSTIARARLLALPTPTPSLDSEAIQVFKAICEKKICFSLRYTDACKLACAQQVANRLRAVLQVPVDPYKYSRSPDEQRPGCIGFSPASAGTLQWAELVRSVLGDGYYVSSDCVTDGFMINVRARPLKVPQ